MIGGLEMLDDDPQGDPIAAQMKRLRSQPKGAPSTDPIDAQMMRIKTQVDPMASTHAAFKSGRLQKNNADLAEGDRVGPGDYAASIAQAAEAPMAGIPGGKLAMSGLRKLTNPSQDFSQVQRDINTETEPAPNANWLERRATDAAKLVGGVAASAVVPGGWSGAQSGAAMAGADQALNNDPDSGLGNRAIRTGAGAVAGKYAGKYIDRGITAVRSMMQPAAATVRLRLLAARASSAKDLYDAAIAEGRGKIAPQAVQEFLASDDIAPIVQELQSTRVHANTAADAPEMLDAVYKYLSDQAGALRGKLGALTPRFAARGRVAAQDVRGAQNEMLDALETPGTFTRPARPAITRNVPAPPPRDIFEMKWMPGETPVNAPEVGASAAPGPASQGWETSAQQNMRPALERHGAENIVSPPLRGEANPVEFPIPKGGTSEPITTAQSPPLSTRDALDAFRAKIGEGARRTSPATEPPWYTSRSQPSATDDIGRRWQQTFARNEPIRAGGGDAPGEWAQVKVGEIPTGTASTEVVVPAMPEINRPLDPFMPRYRNAVEDFARQSRGIENFDRGFDLVKAGSGAQQVAAKNLTRPNKTPEALDDLLFSLRSHAGDAEMVAKGAAAYPKGRFRTGPNLDAAARVLRSTDQVTGNEVPDWIQKALLSLAAQRAPR